MTVQAHDSLSHAIATITVLNDRKLQPYIDTFAITPQNIIEKDHGSLVGFFRIYNHTSESAYIAHTLTSVLKKEFYASTRRSTEDALEAALVKVNAVLGEYVRQNQTAWMGAIDGAVVALTSENMCFSTCGNAQILMVRDYRIMQVNDDPSDAPEHVLTTFSDIACGPLAVNDLFLVASRELRAILPVDACLRACTRYNGDERVQLFRTALINQTDASCVHIITVTQERTGITKRAAALDVAEEQITIPENVFSATAFSQTTPPHTDKSSDAPGSDDPYSAVQNNTAAHFYLQGNLDDTQRTPFSDLLTEHTVAIRAALRRQWTLTRDTVRDDIVRGGHLCATASRRGWHALRAGIGYVYRYASIVITEIRARRHAASQEQIKSETPTETKPDSVEHTQATQSATPSKIAHPDDTSPSTSHRHVLLEEIATDTEIITISPHHPRDPHHYEERLEAFFGGHHHADDHVTEQENAPLHAHLSRITNLLSSFSAHARMSATAWLPRPAKLRALYYRLTPPQRWSAFVIIGCIVVVPFLWVMATRTSQPQKTVSQEPSVPSIEKPSAPDPHSIPVTPQKTSSASETFQVVTLRDHIYAVGPHAIVYVGTDTKTIDFPASNGNIVAATSMPDLNLLFLFTDKNTLFSYSPGATNPFTQNTFAIPSGAKIDAISAYMTYIYATDSTADRIYRYARETGGFTTPTSWLSDVVAFATPRSVTIDGTIFIADADGVLHTLFKRKKAPFPLPTLTPPMHADAIATTADNQPLVILDRAAQRIIAISKDQGVVQKNITHPSFATARSITIASDQKSVIVLGEDSLITTFSLL